MGARVLIISPHNDDALIGCFLYLTGRTSLFRLKFEEAENFILFGSRMSEVALEEAVRFAKDFGIEVLDGCRVEGGVDVVLSPSPESRHPEHRYWAWKSFDTNSKHRVFYSTDMSEWWVTPLRPEDAERKRALLDAYFVPESDLWRYDARYYLFEGYVGVLTYG